MQGVRAKLVGGGQGNCLHEATIIILSKGEWNSDLQPKLDKWYFKIWLVQIEI